MINFRWRRALLFHIGLSLGCVDFDATVARCRMEAPIFPGYRAISRASRARQGRAGVRVRGCRPAGVVLVILVVSEQPIHQRCKRRPEGAVSNEQRLGRHAKAGPAGRKNSKLKHRWSVHALQVLQSNSLQQNSPVITADQSVLRSRRSPSLSQRRQAPKTNGAVSCKRASVQVRRVACMPASTDVSHLPLPVHFPLFPHFPTPVGFVGALHKDHSFDSSSPHSYRIWSWPTIRLSAAADGTPRGREPPYHGSMGNGSPTGLGNGTER